MASPSQSSLFGSPQSGAVCSICDKSYSDPKVLACLHTFCQSCLEGLQDNPEKIQCPKCGQECALPPQGISGLLPDYAAFNILSTDFHENSHHSCTGCRTSYLNAVAQCYSCNNYLCENCVRAHKSMHCFEGHNVVDLKESEDGKTEKLLPCPLHKTDDLIYFCRSCNMLICNECAKESHEIHDYDLLSNISTTQIGILNQLLEQSKAKSCDLNSAAKSINHHSSLLTMQYRKAKSEIIGTFNFYVSMLEDCKETKKKELEAIFNTKMAPLTVTHYKIQKMIDTLVFAERMMKHTNPSEKLMFKQLLDGKLLPTLTSNSEISCQPFDLEFHSNYSAIKVGVKNTFGYLRHNSRVIPSTTPLPIARPSSTIYSNPPYQNGHTFEPKKPKQFSSPNSISPSTTPLSIAGPSSAIYSDLPRQNEHAFERNMSKKFGSPNIFLPSTTPLPIARPSGAIYSDPSHQNGHAFQPNMSKKFGSPDSFLPFSTSLSEIGSYEKWSSNSEDRYLKSPVDSLQLISEPAADSVPQLVDLSANTYPPKSLIQRQKMTYNCKFGEFGFAESQFAEPSGVAVNAQNDIIVADTNNHRIQIFDKEGRYKFQFGHLGKVDGQLMYPNRVAVVKPSGDIIITERSPIHQIQIYNQYGQFVRKFGAKILQHPRGVTVDNKGLIIVVECKVMRVLIFNQLGDVLQNFGCSKHLEFPNGVAVNDKQEIFISDNRAHCVKVFNYDGAFLRRIGKQGLTNYPIGVCINEKGEVLIADNHNNFNLTVFTQDGQLVSAFESKVKHSQCFDVALMDDGSIVLASKDYKLYIYNYVQATDLVM